MEADGGWLPAPAGLSLRVGDVHVWRLMLDQNVCRHFQTVSLLCRSERERAERFHFQADCDRFVASRSVLRILLGRYLECPPRDVRFRYTEHGKPLLLATGSELPIQFNLSHSGEYALYAFAPDRAVGIDVERVRPLMDFEMIIAQVFSSAERELIARAPAEERGRSFFRLWSRKEAYVKAVGHGLSTPLNEVSVEMSSIETSDGHGRNHWYVQDLRCTPSYAAALVTEGQPNLVTCWQWIQPSDPAF